MALETSWLGAAGSQGCVLLAWWSSELGMLSEVSSLRGCEVTGKLFKWHGAFGEVLLPLISPELPWLPRSSDLAWCRIPATEPVSQLILRG